MLRGSEKEVFAWPPDLETIFPLIRAYVADVRAKIAIGKVYLYGSYAKGTQHEDSDVDLCFFSDSFSGKRKWDVLFELFYLKRKYDRQILIEPNAYPTSELTEDTDPFVEEIVRTGIEL
jgi:predicted nucleotidyltransferase